MAYFLVKLDLETSVNVVKYCYPDWMTNEIKTKIINLSNTTPADSFVDIVIQTDIQEEIDLILANGGKELTSEEFETWKQAKLLILSLMEENNELTS